MLSNQTVRQLVKKMSQQGKKQVAADLQRADQAVARGRIVETMRAPKIAQIFEKEGEIRGEHVAQILLRCYADDPDIQHLAKKHKVQVTSKKRRSFSCCGCLVVGSDAAPPVQHMTASAVPAMADVL